MEGLRGEHTVVDDAGSSGDAALVLVAKTHARNTAAASLPKEGREWVGGRRDCEGLYLPRAVGLWCASNALTCATLARDGLLDVLLSADDVLVCCVGMLPVCWLSCRRSGAHWPVAR